SDLAEAAHQLVDVVEGEVGVDAEVDVLAVEEIGAVAGGDQLGLEGAGRLVLAGLGAAGQHDHARRVTVLLGARLGGDVAAHPGGLANAALEAALLQAVGLGLPDDAAAGDVVAIDDDEAAAALDIG